MNNQEFEEKIKAFWKKVQKVYEPFVCKGGLAENHDYYVFQTPVKYAPELMLVGINPGGDGKNNVHWLDSEQNLYTTDQQLWFNTVRRIFGYPDNKKLSAVLENCVGTNKCFVNTGNEQKLANELNAPSTQLIRKLTNEIICPKHIIALGNTPYYTLSKRDCETKQFGSVYLRYGYTENNIPIARIFNPSRINVNRYYTDKLCPDWQAAIEWFMTL